jgi:hypothetical protein
MKTILLTIIILLTALRAISQSDTVRISTYQANRIRKELVDCELAKMQLAIIQRTDSIQTARVNGLQKALSDERRKRNAWYNRKALWAFMGLATGIIITK